MTKLSDLTKKQTKTSSAALAPHVTVEARAGTGKTFTLVEGLKRLRGIPTEGVTPSPQQAAVWEQMEMTPPDASVCFVAFNKSIATELQERVPSDCDAMTLHSLGFAAVRKSFSKVRVNKFRVSDILSDRLGMDPKELWKKKGDMVRAVQKLVSLCKQNLVATDTADNDGDWYGDGSLADALDRLAAHYDVEINGSRDEVFDLVPKVLEACKDVEKDGCIDYDDMVWLPVALGLPLYRYYLLLVDEAQDLNRCQQALAKKAGRRLVFCGDPKQAIYGFAGADAKSMERLAEELGASKAGCVTLPLTVTYRCGRRIVAEAQRIVPDFEAHESNGEGTVSRLGYSADDGEACPYCEGPAAYDPENGCDNCSNTGRTGKNYRKAVNDGDMVLCRVNAPLVGQCFRFLKDGRKANIQGRDIGQGLIKTIDKLSKDTDGSVSELIMAVDNWFHEEAKKEAARRNPDDARMIALEDRRDCLLAFCEDCLAVTEVKKRIEKIFTDDETGGILLSSIHKAKGLEANRVFILQPKGATMPHPMARSAWAKEQEFNLLYVAITRAIEHLVYVS